MKHLWNKKTAKILVIGLILQLGSQFFFSFILWKWNMSNQNNEQLFSQVQANWILYGIMLVCLSPVLEECINRYILFLWPLKKLRRWRFFQSRKGVILCAFLSSVLFSVLHGERFLWPYLTVGLIYCWVAYKTNWMGSACLHVMNNLLVFISMMNQ